MRGIVYLISEITKFAIIATITLIIAVELGLAIVGQTGVIILFVYGIITILSGPAKANISVVANKGQTEIKTLFGNSVFLGLITGLFTSIIAYTIVHKFRNSIFVWIDNNLWDIAVVGIIAIMVYHTLSGIIKGIAADWVISTIQTIHLLIILVCLVLLLRFNLLTPFSLLQAWVISNVVMAICMSVICWFIAGYSFRLDGREVFSLLFINKIAWFRLCLDFILMTSGIIISGILLQHVDTGHLIIVIVLISPLFFLPTHILKTISPDNPVSKIITEQSVCVPIIRAIIIISSIVGLLLIIMGILLMNIVVGNELVQTILLVVLVTPGVMAFGLTLVLVDEISDIGRSSFFIILILFTLTLNIVSCLLLIQKIGIYAVPVSFSIVNLMTLFISIVSFSQSSNNSMMDMFRFEKSDIASLLNLGKHID